MWNRKRDEESPKPLSPPVPPPAAASAPAQMAPHAVEVRKEPTSVSSMPAGRFDAESRGVSATIGKAVKVVGQIFSKEDLYVDGTVEGTVELPEHKLTVGPHGSVQASIKAREVVALGMVQGNVEATERIEIRKDAKLVGDIRTARIVIEDGAYFKGSIDIIKPEPAKVAAKATAPVPVATSAAPGGAAPVPENRR